MDAWHLPQDLRSGFYDGLENGLGVPSPYQPRLFCRGLALPNPF
jgi:hypothetical protein